MTALDFDVELQSLKEASVDRLLNAEICDRQAFERFLYALEVRAQSLKDEHVLPKQFLSYLRAGSGAISSRAEYLPEVRSALDLASKFDLLLDLAIMGESLSDRVPGQPRII